MAIRPLTMLLVQTTSPEDLDEELQYVGATVLVTAPAGGPVLRYGCCVIGCFADPWLVEETIRTHRLGTIVRHPQLLALRNWAAGVLHWHPARNRPASRA